LVKFSPKLKLLTELVFFILSINGLKQLTAFVFLSQPKLSDRYLGKSDLWVKKNH